METVKKGKSMKWLAVLSAVAVATTMVAQLALNPAKAASTEDLVYQDPNVPMEWLIKNGSKGENGFWEKSLRIVETKAEGFQTAINWDDDGNGGIIQPMVWLPLRYQSNEIDFGNWDEVVNPDNFSGLNYSTVVTFKIKNITQTNVKLKVGDMTLLDTRDALGFGYSSNTNQTEASTELLNNETVANAFIKSGEDVTTFKPKSVRKVEKYDEITGEKVDNGFVINSLQGSDDYVDFPANGIIEVSFPIRVFPKTTDDAGSTIIRCGGLSWIDAAGNGVGGWEGMFDLHIRQFFQVSARQISELQVEKYGFYKEDMSARKDFQPRRFDGDNDTYAIKVPKGTPFVKVRAAHPIAYENALIVEGYNFTETITAPVPTGDIEEIKDFMSNGLIFDKNVPINPNEDSEIKVKSRTAQGWTADYTIKVVIDDTQSYNKFIPDEWYMKNGDMPSNDWWVRALRVVNTTAEGFPTLQNYWNAGNGGVIQPMVYLPMQVREDTQGNIYSQDDDVWHPLNYSTQVNFRVKNVSGQAIKMNFTKIDLPDHNNTTSFGFSIKTDKVQAESELLSNEALANAYVSAAGKKVLFKPERVAEHKKVNELDELVTAGYGIDRIGVIGDSVLIVPKDGIIEFNLPVTIANELLADMSGFYFRVAEGLTITALDGSALFTNDAGETMDFPGLFDLYVRNYMMNQYDALSDFSVEGYELCAKDYVTPKAFNPNFKQNPNNSKYFITVPYGTTKLKIRAVLPIQYQNELFITDFINTIDNPKAITAQTDTTSIDTIKQTMTQPLIYDGYVDINPKEDSKVSICIFDANSTTIAYELNIKVDQSTNADLEMIEIGGNPLSGFDKNKNEYTMTVNNNVTSIIINAVAADSEANVSVMGNTNLQVGENNVVITVTAKDGSTIQTYTIKVTREASSSSEPSGSSSEPSGSSSEPSGSSSEPSGSSSEPSGSSSEPTTGSTNSGIDGPATGNTVFPIALSFILFGISTAFLIIKRKIKIN